MRTFVTLLLGLAIASIAAAAHPVCPDGRFVQTSSVMPGSPGGAFGAIEIANGQVSIDGGCAPTKVHLRGRKNGETRVQAKWKQCGAFKKVRLAGNIVADGEPCARFNGVLRAKKVTPVKIGATRSRCDDGIADPAEACIETPARQWTFVPFDDAFCADGSTTGIGVNPGDPGGRLVIYLMGGGACWDELTCYQVKTASHIEGGYGPAEFQTDKGLLGAAAFFDRNDATNPFRNDSWVFVPYCTGDVHSGSNPNASYGGRATKHVGFENMAAYLKRIVPTFPNPTRVILSGSSAGGFGALANWWQTQQAFGTVRVDLIDDSGPTLPAPYLAESIEQTWRNAWNLDAATPPGCTDCVNNIDAIVGFYGAQLPGHRAALLSYTQDAVISAFFQIPGTEVELGLGAIADLMAPFDVWRHFYVTGSTHTVFFTPQVEQNGVSVKAFITQMVTDDPAWATVQP
jgi:hypothetical protein